MLVVDIAIRVFEIKIYFGGNSYMNFRKLTEPALADFALSVATLLGGTQLAAIDSNVRTDLATAIGTLPATLSTAVVAVNTAEAERMAAVSSRKATHKQISDLMSQVQKALKAGIAPKEQFDLCGFDFPAIPVGSYIPRDPSELSVVGFSNGENRAKFVGNNRGKVHYEIWRRQGDSGQWTFQRSITKQSFIDSPVSPGQYYEYRVRAVAARAISNFSNSAVVYGAA